MSKGKINLTLEEYDRLRSVEKDFQEYKEKTTSGDNIYVRDSSKYHSSFAFYTKDEAIKIIAEKYDKLIDSVKYLQIENESFKHSKHELESKIDSLKRERNTAASLAIFFTVVIVVLLCL